jgi:hypothetical protein
MALFKGAINLKKLGDLVRANHACIYTNEAGEKYVNVDIWLNDKEDQFGNKVSIQAQTKKEEPKVYLCNAKEYKPKSASNANAKQTHSEGITNDSFLEQTGIPF